MILRELKIIKLNSMRQRKQNQILLLRFLKLVERLLINMKTSIISKVRLLVKKRLIRFKNMIMERKIKKNLL